MLTAMDIQLAQPYDVVIVGGGMAGASLACALGQLPLKVALIEAYPFNVTTQPHYDDRVIALSQGAKLTFTQFGVWPTLLPAATPIHHIHVSQQQAWGTAQLDRADLYTDALGYVVPARDIGRVLAAVLPSLPQVEVMSPAKLVRFQSTEAHVLLDVEAQGLVQTLSAKLLIAADGAHSLVRESMGWHVSRHDYQQQAIVCNVTFSQAHQHIAYERFQTQGPLAMLPMQDQRMACVWTVPEAAVDDLMGLPDGLFIQRLQAQFGYRAGRIEQVGKRSHYPLYSLQAKQFAGNRVALLGNAAHALHPVAGQGFNLGLRDIQVLANLLTDACQAEQDIGADALLREYTRIQAKDHRWVMGMTHTLIRVFGVRGLPARWIRALGLVGFDVTPWLKNTLTLQAMGLLGQRSAGRVK